MCASVERDLTPPARFCSFHDVRNVCGLVVLRASLAPVTFEGVRSEQCSNGPPLDIVTGTVTDRYVGRYSDLSALIYSVPQSLNIYLRTLSDAPWVPYSIIEYEILLLQLVLI